MSVNLCIDWGNTNVKAAIIENDKFVKSFAISKENKLDELTKILNEFNPQKAILCSVAEHGTEVEQLIGTKIKAFKVLDGYTNLPINNAYLSNDTVGGDRLAMVTAAHFLNPDKNNLVICLGTCITYNLITKNKTFRGGAISPGLRMRFKALSQFTDKLPEVSLDGELLLLGYDSATCIRSGVVFGMAHEIEGMLDEYKKTVPDFNAILTGGDASFFAAKLKSKIFADPDLLLKGLNLIINHNVPIPR